MAVHNYTSEEIDAMLLALDANQGNVSMTALQLNISRRTIQRIIARRAQPKMMSQRDILEGKRDINLSLAGAQKTHMKQSDMAADCERIAQLALKQLEDTLQGAAARDAGVIVGILIDKMRLIRGEATQIIEGRCLLVDGMLSRLTADQLAQYAVLTAIMEGSAPSSVGLLPPPDEDIIEGETVG